MVCEMRSPIFIIITVIYILKNLVERISNQSEGIRGQKLYARLKPA